MTAPDSELIARVVVSDDRAAFGELMRRHQSSVRSFLRHLTAGDAALADDLAQDTFLQAYRSLAHFRGGAAFSTWLLGIARNHHRNAVRRRARLQVLPPERMPAEGLAPSPAAVSDLRHDLQQAFGQLSPEERTALHLAYHQGLSHAEIAVVLDWPLGTVKTHIARGKDRLRELMHAWNP